VSAAWTLAFLVGALAVATVMGRLTHHEVVGTARFPDLNGEGDICEHEECRCGATRPVGEHGRWSSLLCR
jgi:hypothetical protein